MGCLQSKGTDSPRQPSTQRANAESHLQIILKAKNRANVFNAGLVPDENFKPKNISKSEAQRTLISESSYKDFNFFRR